MSSSAQKLRKCFPGHGGIHETQRHRIPKKRGCILRGLKEDLRSRLTRLTKVAEVALLLVLTALLLGSEEQQSSRAAESTVVVVKNGEKTH